MKEPANWAFLRHELARRETVRFWLRDDDAIEPGAALDRLLGLTREFGVPLALAVIPAGAGLALVQRLHEAVKATPVVHGWLHQNHALPGHKKCELGGSRSTLAVLSDLSTALERMQQLFGATLLPMLVPPWNRIDADILPHLHELGFAALSTFGGKSLMASVPVINTHIDLIDWHGTGGSRDHAGLIGDITRCLATSGEPIGILTHHLVHDEAAWNFLEELFQVTGEGSGCRWEYAGDLIRNDTCALSS